MVTWKHEMLEPCLEKKQSSFSELLLVTYGDIVVVNCFSLAHVKQSECFFVSTCRSCCYAASFLSSPGLFSCLIPEDTDFIWAAVFRLRSSVQLSPTVHDNYPCDKRFGTRQVLSVGLLALLLTKLLTVVVPPAKDYCPSLDNYSGRTSHKLAPC